MRELICVTGLVFCTLHNMQGAKLYLITCRGKVVFYRFIQIDKKPGQGLKPQKNLRLAQIYHSKMIKKGLEEQVIWHGAYRYVEGNRPIPALDLPLHGAKLSQPE